MSSGDNGLCLGIDLGTTSVKICLLDTACQSPIFTTSEPTRAGVPGLEAGKDEQEVKKIIDTLHVCLMRVTDKHRAAVKCISVSGQMHGVVLWNSERQTKLDASVPVTVMSSNLYTWQDQRATTDFIASLPEPDSHQNLATGFGCVTLFWLARNDPKMFIQEGCDCAGGIMDYLVTVLCGLDRPVMSEQIAASWGYYNTETHGWNLEILKEAGFPVTLLPVVTSSGSQVGSLQFDWCGISTGTPVLAGLGDLQCATLSALTSETDAVMNISTSSQLCFPVHCSNFTPPRSDNTSPVSYFPFYNQQYLAVAASLNGGNVLTHFVEVLQQWFAVFDIRMPEERIWTKLIESVANIITKSSSLKILPTVFGERHLPDACVTVTGSSESYLHLGGVYRSLCEGIVDNLHMMMPCTTLIESGIKRLVLSGSVADKNPCVKEHVDKVYGKSLVVIAGEGTDSATGAAKVAAQFLQNAISKC